MPGHSFSISNRDDSDHVLSCKLAGNAVTDIHIFHIGLGNEIWWKIICPLDLTDTVVAAIRTLEIETVGFTDVIKEWTPRSVTKIALDRMRNSSMNRVAAATNSGKKTKPHQNSEEEIVNRPDIRIKFDHVSRTWILWASTEEQLSIIRADLKALLKIPPSLIF